MSDSMKKLIKRIRNYNYKKSDEIKPAASIQYTGEKFTFMEKSINVTPTARRQLCTIAKIPADFFIERLMPEEQAMIFNRLYAKMKHTRFMFRFTGKTLYGVVSPKYSVLDNITMVEILKEAAAAGLNFEPVYSVLHPDHTKIRLTLTEYDTGSLVPMIEFTNSENGQGSLCLYAGVYRCVCENGLLVAAGTVSKSRWVHFGSNKVQMPDFRAVLNVSEEYTERFDAARTIYLSSSRKEMLLSQMSQNFPFRVTSKIVEVINGNYRGAQTLFQFLNGVTEAAQTFPAATQTEIELFASSLLSN